LKPPCGNFYIYPHPFIPDVYHGRFAATTPQEATGAEKRSSIIYKHCRGETPPESRTGAATGRKFFWKIYGKFDFAT
jgi:hypothetical protein